jgi:hypothetical protein
LGAFARTGGDGRRDGCGARDDDLAWVALVPFTSELLGNFSDDSVALVFYAVDMAAGQRGVWDSGRLRVPP